MKKILPLFCIFIAISCSREPLDGTVYVIRGDGDITRAAAVDVYILPFKTYDDYLDAYTKAQEQKDNFYIDSYLSLTCETFATQKNKALIQDKKLQDKFSSRCQEEKNAIIGVQDPEAIKNNIFLEKERLAGLVAKEKLMLEASVRSKVTITFDYSDLKFGSVTIFNGTQYIMTSGGRGTGGFVTGKLATNCKNTRVSIDPFMSQTIELGCYYSSEVPELIRLGAPVCADVGEGDLYITLCYDDYAPVNSDRSPGRWQFFELPDESSNSPLNSLSELIEKIQNKKGKMVDFNNLAVKRIGKGKLEKLKSDLEKSTSSYANLESCDLLNSDIKTKESLLCPEIGSGRSMIEKFLENSARAGITNIPSLDIRVMEPMVSFVQRNAIAKTTTDIDGKFNLNKLPNEPFLIYSSYQDKFINVEWLVPIENNENVIELNNANSVFQNDN
ncbi:hypothetical protein OAT62_02195 [Gammaproteobacteria bacterium]|nr:hypothetical protein [Gammaproteobacteria bacterium]